jgi:hypothetical protein
MAFDPSVLSDIGPAAVPDVSGAQAKGFQLKDLIDQNTLNRLKVKQETKASEESDFLSGISKQYDMSKPEEAAKAASAASKAGYPNLTTGIMKQSQALQLGQAQIQEQQLQTAGKVVTIIDEKLGGILNGIRAQTTDQDGKPLMNANGVERYDSKTKDAMVMAGIAQARAEIENENLDPQVKSMLMQSINRFMSQGPPTYDSVNKAYQATQTGRKQFNDELERRQKAAQIGNVESEIEHRKVEERQKDEELKLKKQATQGFGGAVGDLMAALAERGVSLPAGFRSKDQQRSMFEALIARNPGRTADEIADDIKSGKLKLTAETKGAQVAGGQIGKVALASNELDTFGDQTLEASNAIPRGQFVPWNQLKQTVDTKISDPALLRFKTKMQALENAYNQLAARSGTDVDKRAHIHELFNTANSPQAVATLIKALKEEAVGAREAATRTIAETSGSAIPGTDSSHPKDIQSLLDKYK